MNTEHEHWFVDGGVEYVRCRHEDCKYDRPPEGRFASVNVWMPIHFREANKGAYTQRELRADNDKGKREQFGSKFQVAV